MTESSIMGPYGKIYEYAGFHYILDYDEDPDDRTRKNIHMVYDDMYKPLAFDEVPDWGAYSRPTFEEFKEFIVKHISKEIPV